MTADYKHAQDAVGTGDGSAVAFTLTNRPVIPGSQTLYLDGTAKTAGLNYTVNFDTGAVTFKAAPGNGVRVDAVYTYYSVTAVRVTMANAAGGRPVDLTPGITLATYADSDSLATVGNFTVTRYNADSDYLLEGGRAL